MPYKLTEAQRAELKLMLDGPGPKPAPGAAQRCCWFVTSVALRFFEMRQASDAFAWTKVHMHVFNQLCCAAAY